MQRIELIRIAAVVVVMLWAGEGFAGNSSAISGQDIYDSYCGACHGFGGPPLLPNVPNFAAGERLEKSDSELMDSIRDGKGSVMPGWLGVLSDAECEAVLQFIREVNSGT